MIKNINTHSYYSLLNSNLSIDKIIENALANKQEYVFLTDFNLYGSIEFRKKAEEKKIKPIIGLEIFYNNDNLLLFAKSNLGFKNIIKISSFILGGKPFDINDFLIDVIVIFKTPVNKDIRCEKYFSTTKDDQSYIPINEVNFEKESDFIVYKSLMAISTNKTLSKISINDKKNNYFNNIQDEENNNLDEFIKLVDFDFQIKKTNIIKFNIPKNMDVNEYLKHQCFEGIKSKITTINDQYVDRLNYELSVIKEMGFADYFLIVSDFVNEAKNRDILIGPGRGSAAGSLVSFSLGITSIDPIKYNLIFERFLNKNRKTMPDIDIDIMDTRREEIIDYLFEKYGFDHVAHIITYQRIKAKMAIRDVARVLEIDLKIVNRITKLISSEYDEDLMGAISSNQELDQFYGQYTELFIIASKIIDCPRQTGTHAAGIVLSSDELNDIIPTQIGINGYTTTQISMEYLEELGMLKMDLLGLSNLSIIYNVLKLIKLMKNVDIDLSKIPTDDQEVFDAISNADTLGIFQLESTGMRSTLSKIKPRNLEDISLVSAMFRPGPQQNIPEFVKRRFDKDEIEYIDERSKDILEPTNGIIVYQEQVIELVKRVANFDANEADIFRKIISKKDKKELEKVKNEFMEGAIKNGYSEKHAIDIFHYIEKFASYGFNHSHSISYAMISYQMMYLKKHYTIQFMSVLLSTVEGNFDKVNAYCNDCIKNDIKINQPSLLFSKRNFSIYKNQIYFGFANIKGIGSETSKKIVNIRDKNINDFNDFGKIVYHLITNGVGESNIQLLIYSGCFDYLGKTRKYFITNLQEAIRASRNMKSNGEYLFKPKWVNVEQSDQDLEDFNNKQFDLIGFSFKKNNMNFDLINKYRDEYNLCELSNINETNPIGNCLVKVISIKEQMTRYNKLMAFVRVQDFSIENLASFNYELIKEDFMIGDYIICQVKYDPKGKRLNKILAVVKDE